MDIPKDIYQRITKKYGTTLDLKSNPAILEDILRELRSIEQDDFADHQKKTASPFNVPWMDSWAANWLLHQQSSQGQPEKEGQPGKEFNSVLGQLVDLRFRQRLNELRDFLRRYAEPPDGGPPEPGTPPAGPHAFMKSPPPPDPDDFRAPPPPDPEDPDSSFLKSPTPPPDEFRAPPPPDPEDPDSSFMKSSPPPPDPNDFKSPTPPPDEFRAPPPPDPEDPDSSFRSSSKWFSSSGFNPVTEPPDGGPPEPGVPDPPNPGPDPGPDAGGLRDNPWILYWFVSINAPLILNMIDAHITRRLSDLKMQNRRK